MIYRFATLNVFTNRRFTGNPLAVVFGADGLDSSTMQMVAREFGHPETVFVLEPTQPDSTAKIRIFTPAAELPFAGHPTVGTAVILGRDGGVRAGGSIVLEEKIGPVRCTINSIDGERGHAHFTIPELPKQTGSPAGAEAIAAALGLEPADIGLDGFAPARWSAGNSFTFVPVRGIDAIGRCRIDPSKWAAAFEIGSRTSAFVFCKETTEPGRAFHARMFAPGLGVAEDPATGSAAAAFSGYYAHVAEPADGDHRLEIEQGYEMGRPSLIELGLTIRAAKLAAATVGGEAIVVTEGAIEA